MREDSIKFAHVMMQVFETEYLREPNMQETDKFLAIGETRGFSKML